MKPPHQSIRLCRRTHFSPFYPSGRINIKIYLSTQIATQIYFQNFNSQDIFQVLENDAICRQGGVEPLDLERMIDDFVFLVFLVGNDFLPTIPPALQFSPLPNFLTSHVLRSDVDLKKTRFSVFPLPSYLVVWSTS